MKVIDRELIEKLYLEAENSIRKRTHYWLHKSHQEPVQRLLIALVKNSYVDPHFHELPKQWEMFFILEGEIDLEHYSTDGTLVSKKRFAMDGENIAIQIDPKEVHGLRCISDRALLLEIKEGPFKEEYAKTFL